MRVTCGQCLGSAKRFGLPCPYCRGRGIHDTENDQRKANALCADAAGASRDELETAERILEKEGGN